MDNFNLSKQVGHKVVFTKRPINKVAHSIVRAYVLSTSPHTLYDVLRFLFPWLIMKWSKKYFHKTNVRELKWHNNACPRFYESMYLKDDTQVICKRV